MYEKVCVSSWILNIRGFIFGYEIWVNACCHSALEDIIPFFVFIVSYKKFIMTISVILDFHYE